MVLLFENCFVCSRLMVEQDKTKIIKVALDSGMFIMTVFDLGRRLTV